MKISYFKVRCFVCFKSFETPCLPDFTYGDGLFVNSTNEFRYFNWLENDIVIETVDYILSMNPRLQLKNDITKGGFAQKIVSQLADGDFRIKSGYSKCPRCKCRFHSYPNRKTTIKEIAVLTFEQMNQLSLDERLNLISDHS